MDNNAVNDTNLISSRRDCAALGYDFRSSISLPPAVTVSPGFTKSFSTFVLPADSGVLTAISSFIASSMISCEQSVLKYHNLVKGPRTHHGTILSLAALFDFHLPHICVHGRIYADDVGIIEEFFHGSLINLVILLLPPPSF
jgi:hypothetical protein